MWKLIEMEPGCQPKWIISQSWEILCLVVDKNAYWNWGLWGTSLNTNSHFTIFTLDDALKQIPRRLLFHIQTTVCTLRKVMMNVAPSSCLHDNLIITSHDFYVTCAESHYLAPKQHFYTPHCVSWESQLITVFNNIKDVVQSLSNKFVKMESSVSERRCLIRSPHVLGGFHWRTLPAWVSHWLLLVINYDLVFPHCEDEETNNHSIILFKHS